LPRFKPRLACPVPALPRPVCPRPGQRPAGAARAGDPALPLAPRSA